MGNGDRLRVNGLGNGAWGSYNLMIPRLAGN